MAIKVIIPNVSGELKERMRREAYLTKEIIIRTELLKAKGKLNIEDEIEEREPEDEEALDFADEDHTGSAEKSPILTHRRRSGRRSYGSESERAETGDVTDGSIVV